MKTLSKERRYGTLSYLPPLNDNQIQQQISYCLEMGYAPAIEFNETADPETHYWTLWKLPLFEANSTREVLDEVQACRSEYGKNCFIRVVGFDNVKQCQAVSFIVHKPGGNSGSSFRY